MDQDEARATLARLCADHRVDYASLSRMLGRNEAYIQQYISRGSPRRLREEDRRALAQFFGVEESELGGQVQPMALSSAMLARAQPSGMVRVPRYDIGASAGAGSLADDERPVGEIAFEARWLRKLGSSGTGLALIQVDGDSMHPTLSDGDDILVDRNDATTNLRDGIYVLRFEDALMVKRIARDPVRRTLSIISDNQAYRSWDDVDPAQVNLIGRVVWKGQRVA